MIRNVSARLELEIQGHTNMVLSIAAAQKSQLSSERLDISLDGRSITPEELVDRHGSRLHQLQGDHGRMVIEYAAQLDGQAESVEVDPLDLIVYLRPSRYCESDSLLPTA
ncbi:MAG: transglutaminase, partial [Microbacteriaceae bacterium]|nr:transglutaminase [Microbacteriaceae bacterium]